MNRRDLLTGKQKPARSASLGPDYYTNAVLHTHDGRSVRFYDDLVKDKHVAINFMYTRCEGSCPISTGNLLRAQKALGDRVGRDIHMYSITLKPWEDDVAAMKRYAEEHGVGPGWTFLTGDEFDLTTIRYRLFRWDHPALDQNLEQHTGMLRVIHDRTDRWAMCPTLAKPRQIVDVIGWVEPTKPYEERLKENLAQQALIDRGEAA